MYLMSDNCLSSIVLGTSGHCQLVRTGDSGEQPAQNSRGKYVGPFILMFTDQHEPIPGPSSLFEVSTVSLSPVWQETK